MWHMQASYPLTTFSARRTVIGMITPDAAAFDFSIVRSHHG
jgi:hypothetical protein